jgi:hypothetical protein
MAAYYLTDSKLFVNDPGSEALIGGILVACVLYHCGRRIWLKRAGYEPDMAFHHDPARTGRAPTPTSVIARRSRVAPTPRCSRAPKHPDAH